MSTTQGERLVADPLPILPQNLVLSPCSPGAEVCSSIAMQLVWDRGLLIDSDAAWPRTEVYSLIAKPLLLDAGFYQHVGDSAMKKS